MIITTSEYNYYNIKSNETCNIVENTLQEHEQNYGVEHLKIVKVKCVAEFLDKKNEIKNIIIQSSNINEESTKVMISSEGAYTY